jgi:hypothetical protein
VFPQGGVAVVLANDVYRARHNDDHAIREFVAWYCSEPRLAFNRTVVLRYRIYLEQRGYAPATINLRLTAVRRVAYAGRDQTPECDSCAPIVSVSRE